MTRSILMAFGSLVLASAQPASGQLPPGARTPTRAEIERTVPPIGRDVPFHLVDGFIMVEGAVNGESGFYMLDTGSPFALFLNNHLPHARPVSADRLRFRWLRSESGRACPRERQFSHPVG